MISVGSESVLSSWPDHEWKQASRLPQQHNDEGLAHLVAGPEQADSLVRADSPRNDMRVLSRRGSISRRVVSRLGAIFTRRR